ncbi:hypothetical protein GCM10020331_025840 [Ectobacillus funiculus]
MLKKIKKLKVFMTTQSLCSTATITVFLKNHDKAMAQFLGKEEITTFDHVNLQRTPLFIHVPGQTEGKKQFPLLLVKWM